VTKGFDVDFKIHAGFLVVGLVVLVVAAKHWIRNHASIGTGHPHF
jgi:hypothetical protein